MTKCFPVLHHIRITFLSLLTMVSAITYASDLFDFNVNGLNYKIILRNKCI